jgi:hypothetical protein
MALKIGKHLSKSLGGGQFSDKFFTVKGSSSSGELIINKDDLIAALVRLRESEYVPIKKLSGSLKSDYETLTKYINLVQPTNTYPMLKSLIDKYFYDVENVAPGTVGAYFCGNNLNVNVDPKECSAVTAGSIPLEGDDWKTCKNNVILAENTNSGYDFTVLVQGEDKSHTYLYVKNLSNYDDFDGFSSDEKKKLKKYGVEYVNLYGHEDSINYQNLVSNTMHLDEVKCRKHQHKENDKSGGHSWLLIFLVIIIVIIIIAVAYRNMGSHSEVAVVESAVVY